MPLLENIIPTVKLPPAINFPSSQRAIEPSSHRAIEPSSHRAHPINKGPEVEGLLHTSSTRFPASDPTPEAKVNFDLTIL
ncbi:hypothetical protein E4U54_002426 [Claviceps lovelessii]|nr:hypothetical protein E4U54_002426 [Claviceps lovelessii]